MGSIEARSIIMENLGRTEDAAYTPGPLAYQGTAASL